MAVRASREELYTKFKEAAALPVDDQAKVFLRAFAVDFQGAFEEVLDVANEWKVTPPPPHLIAFDLCPPPFVFVFVFALFPFYVRRTLVVRGESSPSAHP